MRRFVTGRRFDKIVFETVQVKKKMTDVISGFGRFVEDGFWDFLRRNKQKRQDWVYESLDTFKNIYNPTIDDYRNRFIQGCYDYVEYRAGLVTRFNAANKDYRQKVAAFRSRSDQGKTPADVKVQISTLLDTDAEVKASWEEVGSEEMRQLRGYASAKALEVKELRSLFEQVTAANKVRMALRKELDMLQDPATLSQDELAKVVNGFRRGRAPVDLTEIERNPYSRGHLIPEKCKHPFNRHETLSYSGIIFGKELVEGLSDVILKSEQVFLDDQWDTIATQLTNDFKKTYGYFLAIKRKEVEEEKQALAETAFNCMTKELISTTLEKEFFKEFEKFVQKEGAFTVYMVKRSDLATITEKLDEELRNTGIEADIRNGYPLGLLQRDLESYQHDLQTHLQKPSFAGHWAEYQQSVDMVAFLTGDANARYRADFIQHLRNAEGHDSSTRTLFGDVAEKLAQQHPQYDEVKQVLASTDTRVPALKDSWLSFYDKQVPNKTLLKDADLRKSFNNFLTEKCEKLRQGLVKRDSSFLKRGWYAFLGWFNLDTEKETKQKEITEIETLQQEIEFSSGQDAAQLSSEYVKIVVTQNSQSDVVKNFVAQLNASTEPNAPRFYSARLVALLDDTHFEQFYVAKENGANVNTARKMDTNARCAYFKTITAEGVTAFKKFLKDESIKVAGNAQAVNGAADEYIKYLKNLYRVVQKPETTLVDQKNWMLEDVEDDFLDLLATKTATDENIAELNKYINLIRYNYALHSDDSAVKNKLDVIDYFSHVINGDSFVFDSSYSPDVSSLGSGNFIAKLARNCNTNDVMTALAANFTKHYLKKMSDTGSSVVAFENEGADKLNTYHSLIKKHPLGSDLAEQRKVVATEALEYFSSLLFSSAHKNWFNAQVVGSTDAVDLSNHLLNVVRDKAVCANLALSAGHLTKEETPILIGAEKFLSRDLATLRKQLSLCYTSDFRDKFTVLTQQYLEQLIVFVDDPDTLHSDIDALLEHYAAIFGVIFTGKQLAEVAAKYFERLFKNDVSVKIDEKGSLFKFFANNRESVKDSVADVIARYIKNPKQKQNPATLAREDKVDSWWDSETAKTILLVGSPENVALYTVQRIKEIFALDASPDQAYDCAEELIKILGVAGIAKIQEYFGEIYLRNVRITEANTHRAENEQQPLVVDELTPLLLTRLESSRWRQAHDYLASNLLKTNDSKVVIQHSRIEEIGRLLTDPSTSETECDTYVKYVDSGTYAGVAFADEFITASEAKSQIQLNSVFSNFVQNILAPQGVMHFVNKEPFTIRSLRDFVITDTVHYKNQLVIGRKLANKQFDESGYWSYQIVLQNLNLLLFAVGPAYMGANLANDIMLWSYLKSSVDVDADVLQQRWNDLGDFFKACLLKNPAQGIGDFTNFRSYDEHSSLDINYLGAAIYGSCAVDENNGDWTPPASALLLADTYSIIYLKAFCEGKLDKTVLNNIQLAYPAFSKIAGDSQRQESYAALNQMLAAQFNYPFSELTYTPGYFAFTEEKERVALKYGNADVIRIALLARVAAIFDKAARNPDNDNSVREDIAELKRVYTGYGIENFRDYLFSLKDANTSLGAVFEYYIKQPKWSVAIEYLTNNLVDGDFRDALEPTLAEKAQEDSKGSAAPMSRKNAIEAKKGWTHLCRLKHLQELYHESNWDKDVESHAYNDFSQASLARSAGLATTDAQLTHHNLCVYLGENNLRRSDEITTLKRYGLSSLEEILTPYLETVTKSEHTARLSRTSYFSLTTFFATPSVFSNTSLYNRWSSLPQEFKDHVQINSLKSGFMAAMRSGNYTEALRVVDNIRYIAVNKATKDAEYEQVLMKHVIDSVLEFIRQQISQHAVLLEQQVDEKLLQIVECILSPDASLQSLSVLDQSLSGPKQVKSVLEKLRNIRDADLDAEFYGYIKKDTQQVADSFKRYRNYLPDQLQSPTNQFYMAIDLSLKNSLNVLGEETVQVIFSQLADAQFKGYKDEVYDVIASLYSSDKSSDQQIIQKFSAAMKVENSRDIQADRWHAIKQLYEQVIKPRAHELRFGKVLSRLDFSNRQATAEQLANLLATSGFILSGSTVDFYTPAAILRAVTAVLTDIKGLNLANTISLQDFLKALAKERIRHLTDALSSLAHEFSQSAANNSSVAETCNTEQAALIAERKVLNSIVEDQSNTSFARPESIGLLMNFMDHVMARLGEERKTRAKDSLRAEENEKLAVLQREARSIVEVSESDALLSSLSAILDSPIMATVIDHGSKDRVSALLSPEAVYAVNQLYKDLVAAIASDDQIAISFADSAVLFDGLDLERKKLLSEKLISAVTRAENAGNFRRLSHLTALKNFISEVENYSDYMDNSPYKALVAEEKKTNLYLGTLAQLDQLIMGIYTNSALGLRLNELLIAWETLKELNGGKTFIYLKELTKENGFVHIAKILADNANTPILCAVKNLITKDDATARTVLVKYHGYDMRLINFSTDGNIAQLSRPGYAFTALFTPAEVSDLAQKQAELYTFICCIAELYKMRDSAGIVASAQFKEFLSLWTDGAGTYLDFPTKKHAAVFGANHIIPSYENRFKSYFDSKFYTKLDADFATAKNNFTNDELISHIDMKVTQIKVILKTLCSFLADFSKGGHPWVIQSLTDGVKSLSAALGNNNLKVACLKIYLDVLKDMKGAQAARENSPLYMLTVKKDMLLKKAGSADMGLETDDFNDFMACYNAVIEGDNVPEAVMSEAEEVRHQLHTVFSSAQFGSRVSMFGSRGTAVNEDTHSLRSRTTAVAEGTSRSPDRTSLSSKGRGEALSRTASVADYSIFSSGGRVSSVRVSPEAARDNRAGSDASSVRSSASTPAKKGAK